MECKYEWQNQPGWQLSCMLDKIPHSEYPRIWYELNDWKWPEELGELPDGLSWNPDDFSPIILDLVKQIESCVGKKACLRYSHKRNFGSTDQMFDDWWDSQENTDFILKNSDSESHHAIRTALCTAFSFLLGLLVSVFFT